MKVTDTYYINAGEIIIIPAVQGSRRTIAVPLLLTITQNIKQSSELCLYVNSVVAAKVKAEAGSVECKNWTGIIEPGNITTIKLTSSTSSGGESLHCATIFVGSA